MMQVGEAVLGSIVENFVDRIVQGGISLYGVRDQVEWLKREQQRLQCFLNDVDAKKNEGGMDSEMVNYRVGEMRGLASEVERVIGTCMNLNIRDSMGLIRRLQIHKGVRGIKAMMHELSQSKALYDIAIVGETMGTTRHPRSQDKTSILPPLNDDIDIVGFDEEKKMIMQQLVDTSNTNRSVISIADMDGLGKTALVEAIYNDPEVSTSFDLVAWITISQKYTIMEILKNILSLVSGTPSNDTIEILAVNLSDQLKKCKYLIILADVWEENVWDQLQSFFPDVNNGSRVIITTRFSNVSRSMHFQGDSVHSGTNYPRAVSPPSPAARTSLNMTDPTNKRRVVPLQISPVISHPTVADHHSSECGHLATNERRSPPASRKRTSHGRTQTLNQRHAPISQTHSVTPRTSLSIPITEEILRSKNELKKTSIISVISGQTSEKHLQEELPVVLNLSGGVKVSPFGINTFVISFHSEKDSRTAESMGLIQLDGRHGLCTVSLVPWSPELGSMGAATGSYRRITVVNLPLHCRDWATLVELVKPAGDLVAVQKDDKVTLEFVYVLVRLRRVINLPLELELTVGMRQYLIHLEDSQTFEPYNSGRSTFQGHAPHEPPRSTHEIPRNEKGKMRAREGDDT
ncbi:putative virus X resistance protein-like, coiled-coil [Dioscorea sansibarensis]